MSAAPDTFRSDWKKKPTIEIGPLFDKQPPFAMEAEMALLGGMILDWQVTGEVAQILKGAEDFYKPAHGTIYTVLLELYDQAQSIDMVQLNQRLVDKGVLEEVGGLEYLVDLVDGTPSAHEAPRYALIVRDKAILRRLIESAGQVLHECYHSDEPVNELLDRAETAIFELAEKKDTASASDIGELLKETYERLEREDGQEVGGIKTGFRDLDDMTNGVHSGEMIIIAARPSMGKAQPLDAGVLTPTGWRAMGDLEVGDAVASVDGAPSLVTGVFPQGERQVYRVTLADGRSAECCAEHLWSVTHRGWDGPRVVETAELMRMLGKSRYQNRLWVEPFSGDYGDDGGLPLSGYALGCLLGDGNLKGTSVRFSNDDPAVLAAFTEAIGEGYELNAAGGFDYRVARVPLDRSPTGTRTRVNELKAALTEMDLWDRGAADKFIPAVYFSASRASRARLMAGLIDTDGWVEAWGSLRFATASKQLARDVVTLMRSLGGTGSYTVKQTAYTYRGEKKRGLPAYVCNLQHPDPSDLVTAPSKLARMMEGGTPRRARQRRLNIRSIEPTRVTETQCIAVSHPRRLYVTDGYTVTHNTAFALNIAETMAATNKIPVGVFSLEMSKQQLAQRLLCSRSGVDSQRMRRNMLTHDDFAAVANTVSELSEAPLYIDDTPGLTLMGLRAKARRMKQRYDIQCLVVDYLQLMTAPSAGRDGRQNEVSAISRGVKALAREIECPVLCLSQLNRAAEQREGHRPRMSDLRESGSIEQDADVIMMLHREDYYHRGEDDYEDNNLAEVIVNKQRNGPTGTVKLVFNGGTTRFEDLATGAQMAAAGY